MGGRIDPEVSIEMEYSSRRVPSLSPGCQVEEPRAHPEGSEERRLSREGTRSDLSFRTIPLVTLRMGDGMEEVTVEARRPGRRPRQGPDGKGLRKRGRWARPRDAERHL